ncbi:MAG TPA: urea ABC transporter permease subunit UrtC, partial [Deltaproteobacteria bacterium]|nr:urea ABC transporter permease subunit UrtC [Deltaproteobacteria bacterium]
KDVLGIEIQADSTRRGLFIISALALAGGFVLCRWLLKTHYGKVLLAVRDAESRSRFLGYRTANYKLFA